MSDQEKIIKNFSQTWPMPSKRNPIIIIGTGGIVKDAHLPAYKKAGFKLLPNNGEKNLSTAINIMTYTLFLIPLGLLPTIFGITGLNSAVVAVICAILFLIQTLRLINDHSNKSALRIMFSSFIYLPVVQIAYIIDKI